MSHFAVLVITNQKPTEKVLSAALQPFHEFECTGVVDQYIQSVDQLQEAWEEFAAQRERRFKAPDGTLFCPYEDQFYREPTDDESKQFGKIAGTGCGQGISWSSKDWGDGLGYRTKIHFKPDGFEEIELNTSDTKTFGEFVADYYGRTLLVEGAQPDLEDEHQYGWYRVNAEGEVTELIKRTNPNKKWDWWQVGGRWSGFLTPKKNVAARPDSDPNVPGKGRSGLMGEEANSAGADVIRKCDVDFDAMRNASRKRAGKLWDKVRSITGDLSDFVPWDKARDELYKGDSGKAREFYSNQRAMKAISEASQAGDRDLYWVELDDLIVDRATYVEKAALSAIVLFAVLKNGKWVERGEMGWWDCVSNENHNWDRDFNKMLDDLPDDTWLTVVDCHI